MDCIERVLKEPMTRKLTKKGRNAISTLSRLINARTDSFLRKEISLIKSGTSKQEHQLRAKIVFVQRLDVTDSLAIQNYEWTISATIVNRANAQAVES